MIKLLKSFRFKKNYSSEKTDQMHFYNRTSQLLQQFKSINLRRFFQILNTKFLMFPSCQNFHNIFNRQPSAGVVLESSSSKPLTIFAKLFILDACRRHGYIPEIDLCRVIFWKNWKLNNKFFRLNKKLMKIMKIKLHVG